MRFLCRIDDYRYQYNGKELNEDLGLNWLDYGARWYDPAIGRWGQLDPLAHKYYSLTPYAYVGNMPTIAIDPDGERIIIVNNAHAQQVLQDLGKIYATKRGRAIIDALAASNTTYRIDGSTNSIWGGYFWGTRYNRGTNNLIYSQNFHQVDRGAVTYSYITLAHELYHAYQDENNIEYNADSRVETEAVKFENYIRDVMGGSSIEHRTSHSGIPVTGETAFPSYGERVDPATIKVQSYAFGDIYGTDREEGEGDVKRDNTRAQKNTMIFFRHVLQYMTENGIQYLRLELDQRPSSNERP